MERCNYCVKEPGEECPLQLCLMNRYCHSNLERLNIARKTVERIMNNYHLNQEFEELQRMLSQ